MNAKKQNQKYPQKDEKKLTPHNYRETWLQPDKTKTTRKETQHTQHDYKETHNN